jgi:hypothetical protein
MKCTLRKVAEGIVATVNERPKANCWIYDNLSENAFYFHTGNFFDNDCDIIIASNFKISKKICMKVSGYFIENPLFDNEEMGEYEYKETETRIIIEL